MSWRDHMGPASFRGAKFHVESSERTGGRRTVKHEFFGRDDPYIEDTGRKAGSFQVEGYVLGDEYLTDQDALIAALEDTSGPGQLVHPYHGTKQVICSGFRVRNTAKDGGIAYFSIDFDPTPVAPASPTATLDTAAALKSSASGALAAARAEFVSLAEVGKLAAGALSKLAGMVSSASHQLQGLLGPLAQTEQGLAQLQTSLTDLAADAGSLVRAPGSLFDTIASTIGALSAAGDPVRSVRALIAAYEFSPGLRPLATTPREQLEQQTHDATQRMIQQINLVQATLVALEGVAPRGTTGAFPSYEDAIAIRDLLAGKLDEQLDVAGDTAFPGLMQLRADLVLAVPGPDADLARLVSYTPIVTVPSLVLSHRLYGTIAGEADLLARNHVAHPGFVVGGAQLQVLSEV